VRGRRDVGLTAVGCDPVAIGPTGYARRLGEGALAGGARRRTVDVREIRAVVAARSAMLRAARDAAAVAKHFGR
jgi:hypothetical protein